MSTDRQRYALQVIFSVFLGLMVTAFIGVGVNTFYPEPDYRYETDPEVESLYREQDAIYDYDDSGPKELTAAEEQRIREINEEIREIEDARQDPFESWARTTSIILIIFATIVMGISLVRSEQLRIISNGLLLGGVFTMLYGTGWVIASGSSVARFAVMTFALVVTFVLGYARFVRGRSGHVVVGADVTSTTPQIAELEGRVELLERQLAGAAAALGAHDDEAD